LWYLQQYVFKALHIKHLVEEKSG